ncbi:MAG: DUF4127 family protein, partial [Acidobacteriota bacterium]
LYHDLVRPEVNARLREEAKRTGEITYQLDAERYAMVDRDVSQSLAPRIREFFVANFRGRSYPLAGSRLLRLNGLHEPRVYLPWARTFECVIEFELEDEVTEQ